nr:hypothetical protein [Tanacetum cinerariifolium]
MPSDSHDTITYTSMSSYEVPPSPDYIPGPEASPSPDYIPGPEYPEYLPPADDVFLAEEQPLPATVSPTVESPGYITDLELEMEPEEEDEDDEKSEGNSIDYSTNRGDDDVDDEDIPIASDEFPLLEEVPTASEESFPCYDKEMPLLRRLHYQ